MARVTSPTPERPALTPAVLTPADEKELTLLVMNMLDTYQEAGAAPRAVWKRRFETARTKARSLHAPDSAVFLGLETHVVNRPTPYIAAVTLALFAYYRTERAHPFGRCLTFACDVCKVDAFWRPPIVEAEPEPDRAPRDDKRAARKEHHARSQSAAPLWNPH